MQHATKAYGQVAQQTASPRELEVQLLLRAASRLQAVHDDWDDRAPGALDQALHFNRKLWTIFLTSVTTNDNPLPAEIRQNVANLGIVRDEPDAVGDGQSAARAASEPDQHQPRARRRSAHATTDPTLSFPNRKNPRIAPRVFSCAPRQKPKDNSGCSSCRGSRWSAARPAGSSASPGSAPRLLRSTRLRRSAGDRSASRWSADGAPWRPPASSARRQSRPGSPRSIACRRGTSSAGADTVIERRAARGRVRIAVRHRDGGESGDLLNLPADAFLVRAQAVGHADRPDRPWRWRWSAPTWRRLRRCTRSRYWRWCR